APGSVVDAGAVRACDGPCRRDGWVRDIGRLAGAKRRRGDVVYRLAGRDRLSVRPPVRQRTRERGTRVGAVVRVWPVERRQRRDDGQLLLRPRSHRRAPGVRGDGAVRRCPRVGRVRGASRPVIPLPVCVLWTAGAARLRAFADLRSHLSRVHDLVARRPGGLRALHGRGLQPPPSCRLGPGAPAWRRHLSRCTERLSVLPANVWALELTSFWRRSSPRTYGAAVTELLLLVARRTSLEAKRERPDLSAMQVPRRRLRGAEFKGRSGCDAAHRQR